MGSEREREREREREIVAKHGRSEHNAAATRSLAR